MKYILLLMIFFIYSCNMKVKTNKSVQITEYKEKGIWIQLFNGKDLNDWTCKFAGKHLNENYKNTFRVEDGLLKVSYDEYDIFNNKFGHLFYKSEFSNYKLRVEYRFTGEQTKGTPAWAYMNNGIMIHSQSPQSMTLNQPFPVSIEVQLVGTDKNTQRPTAGVCTPGVNIEVNGKLVTQNCVQSIAKTYKNNEWVTVEVIVLGNSSIQHFIDGKKVLEYHNPVVGGTGKPDGYAIPDGTPLTKGYIAVQAEGHPAEFKKIELIELEVTETNINTPKLK